MRGGVIVRRAFTVSPSLTLRTDFHCGVQMPAKKASGLSSLKANHTGGREPSANTSFSEKLVKGTTQRLSMPSQRRQWGDFTFRTLVMPESELRPLRANAGDGMPQRAIASSRVPE